jgi:hypothetical protein
MIRACLFVVAPKKSKSGGECLKYYPESKWSSIRHTKWFIPVVMVLCTLLIGGAVFAVGAISNVWTSPGITVTEPTQPPQPPSNLPLVISSLDFTENRSISVDEPTLVGVSLSNPSLSGAPGYVGVLVQFTINKTGIEVGDVDLEYSIDAGVNWLPLPLAQNGADELIGTFGPAVGFPVGYAYNMTTPLRVTFAEAGEYYATAQAIQVVP